MTVQEREYTVRQEGIEKGLARGRAEGIEEGREKIIAQMRASGMSEEQIKIILNTNLEQ